MRFLLVVLLSMTLLDGCRRSEPSGPMPENVSLLIDWQPGPTYLGVYYAKEIGAFAASGFDVTIDWVRGAHEAIAAVATGEYPIATASGGATVVARSEGTPIKSLAVLYPEISTVVFGLASMDIRAPSDLEGKRIGIYPGSINNEEFQAFVRANELDASKISIVPISGDDVEALLNGEVEAVLNYRELSPARLEVDPRADKVDGRRTFQIPLAEYGVHAYGLNIVSSDSLVVHRPEMLKALRAAVLEGYFQGCTNPTEAVDAFLTLFPELSRDYITTGWAETCRLIASKEHRQSTDGWGSTIAIMGVTGSPDHPVTADSLMAAL